LALLCSIWSGPTLMKSTSLCSFCIRIQWKMVKMLSKKYSIKNKLPLLSITTAFHMVCSITPMIIKLCKSTFQSRNFLPLLSSGITKNSKNKILLPLM
jgi:hypothetical protein